MSVLEVEKRVPLVALVGNPNAGKTSVFNALTGAFQKVANYAGVTVEKVSGRFSVGDQAFECVDVPGLYSLAPISVDEQVATDVVLGHGHPEPDVIVYVADASHLERNLFLFSQVAELGKPMVLALTMVDVLQRRGETVDLARLREELGVPIVSVVAHKGQGVSQLKQTVAQALEKVQSATPHIRKRILAEAEAQPLLEAIERAEGDRREVVRRALLGEDPAELQGDLVEKVRLARESIERVATADAELSEADRYLWCAHVRENTIVPIPKAVRTKQRTDALDKLLTHRVLGLAVFVALMYLVFQSIYTFAAPFMDAIEAAFGWLGDSVGGSLAAWPVLQSLVVDGLVAGVGGVVVFLPQILILFFFISALEGSGYFARAAFLMDRLLGWCGLNGRAFIPLLSSFACAIPGIMAARVMPDAKSRLATILVAPLMSCSARLPVYILFIGAFIEPIYGPGWAGFALFAMHFVGLAFAIPIALVLNRRMLRGKRMPFLLELPAYQWPKWKDVVRTMWTRGAMFVKTAGTIIVVMSVMIWALLFFPNPYPEVDAQGLGPEEQEHLMMRERIETSFLGQFGKVIEPVFAPAGFDWRIGTAILAAFPAREVVVPSLGIIFSLGGEVDEESGDLREALHSATWPDGRKLMTPWTAAGLMVFFALCCQCGATLATVKRETNSWKWPVFMFVYMTGLAYVCAVAIYQLGRAFGS